MNPFKIQHPASDGLVQQQTKLERSHLGRVGRRHQKWAKAGLLLEVSRGCQSKGTGSEP